MAAPRVLNLMLAATPGGLETMAVNYHLALAGRGVDVLSLGLRDSWFARATAEAGLRFEGLPAASPIDPRQSWRVRRAAMAFGADVVVAHGSRGAAVAVPALAARTPLAVVMHNMRARRAAARADLMIGVSAVVVADIRARFPKARVALVENFAPLGVTPVHEGFADPPLIGALGRLHEEKGFDILLEAAALMRSRGRRLRLSLVGEGPAAAALRASAAKLDLTDVVDFPGWIAPPQRFLSTLDIFACPSRTEAFGLAVVEAMAAGAPVVATDIEGPRDLLGRGRYGRLVAPQSPAALADALAAALDDPAATLAMARLAQAEAVAPYTLEAGGERLWAALAPLVAASS